MQLLVDGHVHVNNFYRGKKNKLDMLADRYLQCGFDAIFTTDHFKKKDFDKGLTYDRYWAPYEYLRDHWLSLQLTSLEGLDLDRFKLEKEPTTADLKSSKIIVQL